MVFDERLLQEGVFYFYDTRDIVKVIELFAGARGLALGLEWAGSVYIILVEFDNDAVNTKKTNRLNWNVICDDIENVAEHAYMMLLYNLDWRI